MGSRAGWSESTCTVVSLQAFKGVYIVLWDVYTWNGDEDDLLVTPLLGGIVGHRGTAGRESLLLLSPWDVPITILSMVSLIPLPQLD